MATRNASVTNAGAQDQVSSSMLLSFSERERTMPGPQAKSLSRRSEAPQNDKNIEKAFFRPPKRSARASTGSQSRQTYTML